MAGHPAPELTAAPAADVFSDAARTTLAEARDRFLLHLAGPVLRHERALREGRFPWDESTGELADLGPIVHRYPVLARAIAAWTDGWSRAHAQLATRFAKDWPGCRIERIAPYRSDPHDGQQTVAILVLSDGRVLVYKPRPLAMEEAFGELLEWANARGFRWPYARVDVVPRDGYGWMEHVAAAPCASASEVDAFYKRAGGLLCLLALLQATDIHHENLIAAGDQPVLVDLETIGHPRPAPIDFAQALRETGFLPAGTPLDFSALGATESFDTPFAYRVPLRENVPAMNGRRPTAAEHAAAVTQGFAEMYRLVIENDARELLHRFGGRRVREIRRSSNDYGLLLRESLQPRFMRDAALRRQLFERLRGLTGEELQALERFDVPCFTAVCDPAPLLAAYERLSLSELPVLLATIHHALTRRRDSWPTNNTSAPR